MISTPIYQGKLQSDLDFSGFNPVNLTGWPPVGGGGGGGGGSNPLITINVKDAPYSATGNGTTDDTVAIQAAINAVAALGGGRIYFPAGVYKIAGALQDTGARNAQLLLPNVDPSSHPVTIEFLGALPPPITFYINGMLPSAAVYSTLKSTLTGATGSAACIAGSKGSFSFSNVQLVVRDMIFQAPPDPTFTAFNLTETSPPQFYNVLIHCGDISGNPSLGFVPCTHGQATAIKLVKVSNSGGQVVMMVDVWGFFTALESGELATVHLGAWGCTRGVVVSQSFNLSTILRLLIVSCRYGIVSDNTGDHYLQVLAYDNEFATGSGPTFRQYDVDDAGNHIRGNLKFCTVLSGSGNDHTFIKNGGANFSCSELGVDQAQTFYIGTDARLVAITGGTKLQVRNPSTNTWVDGDSWTNP